MTFDYETLQLEWDFTYRVRIDEIFEGKPTPIPPLDEIDYLELAMGEEATPAAPSPRIPDPDAYIRVAPGRQFGRPCVGNTRMTAESLAEIWWCGNLDPAAIADNWTGMGRAQILVACWYQAAHGTRTWRKRWRLWANDPENSRNLWEGNFDEVPLPPQREGE